MAWLRVQLTDEERDVVNEDRISHPNDRIRERMLVVWLLHNGVTRQKAADTVPNKYRRTIAHLFNK